MKFWNWGIGFFLLAGVCTTALADEDANPASAANSNSEQRILFGIDDLPRLQNAEDEQLAKELGLGLLCDMAQWRETAPGDYVWNVPPGPTSYPPGLNFAHLMDVKKKGYKIAITFTNVHMDQKHPPEYLSDKRFNDPYMLERLEAFLTAFLERYGDAIDYLNIGNEVDIYFGGHKDEWPDYVEYVRRASEVVHRLRPAIKFGVVLQSSGAPGYWKDIEPFCDVFTTTYYTPNSGFFEKMPTANVVDPEHPSYFGRVLDRCLELAGDKPVLITEMGCATHPTIDSSPEIQVDFIRKLFAWLKPREQQIVGITWCSLVDWSYEGLKESLQGALDPKWIEHEPFLRFLSSFGLKYEDGTPKPGYAVFKDELTHYQRGE